MCIFLLRLSLSCRREIEGEKKKKNIIKLVNSLTCDFFSSIYWKIIHLDDEHEEKIDISSESDVHFFNDDDAIRRLQFII